MLAIIESKKIEPSKSALMKMARPYFREESSFKSNGRGQQNNIDKFWDQRYLLFQKFDEGISLDQESWRTLVPQAIAEYLSNKIKCQTVLDAFCGAGGNSIKLANTCSRVIATDINLSKLKCLSHNAKVCCVDNIKILHQNFLTLQEEFSADIVFLHPQIKN